MTADTGIDESRRRFIDVLLASDARGAEGVAVAVASALQATAQPVRLWIIEEGISAAVQEQMAAAWRSWPSFGGAVFRSLLSLPVKLPGWWVKNEFPKAAYARFEAAEILPADAARCIYLDFDTFVGTDLATLFDVDMDGLPIGMVPNTGLDEVTRDYVRGMGLDPNRYCNSGVMLIDLEAWRRDAIGKQLIAHGKDMSPSSWFFDQDLLNSFFKDRCLLLDERWNLRDAGADPAGNILHFAGAGKPWSSDPSLDGLAGIEAWRRLRATIDFTPEPHVAKRGLADRLWILRAKLQRRAMEIVRGQRRR